MLGFEQRYFPQGETEELTGLSEAQKLLLAEALRVMKPEDQSLLVPYYAYGFSVEEIAGALGVTHKQARDRLYIAMRRTRQRLGIWRKAA